MESLQIPDQSTGLKATLLNWDADNKMREPVLCNEPDGEITVCAYTASQPRKLTTWSRVPYGLLSHWLTYLSKLSRTVRRETLTISTSLKAPGSHKENLSNWTKHMIRIPRQDYKQKSFLDRTNVKQKQSNNNRKENTSLVTDITEWFDVPQTT